MYNLKKINLLLLLFILMSCERIFKDDLDDYIHLDNQEEVLDILHGLYAQLAMIYDEYYFEDISRGDDLNIYPYYYFEHATGVCSGGATHDYSPNYFNIYHWPYRIILSANSAILQLDPQNDKHILGEFYFLRAYAYFILSRFFGNPFLVDDIEVKFDLERPSYEQVFEFIEADLIKALNYLPDSPSELRVADESPGVWTAQALLAELYLCWAGYPIYKSEKYMDAMLWSKNVIDNRSSIDIELLEDYGHLFDGLHLHNKESLFALYFNRDQEETTNRIAGNSNGGGYASEGMYLVSGRYKPGFKFYDYFPEGKRKSKSFPKYSFGYLDPVEDPCTTFRGVCTMKWLDSSLLFTIPEIPWESPDDYGTNRTLYLLRYAQTILTFAESRARLGILDESTYEAINMIRRRALGVDPFSPADCDLKVGLSQDQLLDSIVWERAWELNFEPNGRWFDIIRLDMKNQFHDLFYDHDIPYAVLDEYLQENWYFYKIPKTLYIN